MRFEGIKQWAYRYLLHLGHLVHFCIPDNFILLRVIVNYNWATIEAIFCSLLLVANPRVDSLCRQNISFATESQRRSGKLDVHKATMLVIYSVRTKETAWVSVQ